jgi:hypothetical protein
MRKLHKFRTRTRMHHVGLIHSNGPPFAYAARPGFREHDAGDQDGADGVQFNFSNFHTPSTSHMHVPDLRFEQTYLRSISKYLHTPPPTPPSSHSSDVKREPSASTVSGSGEEIDWKVLRSWEYERRQWKGKTKEIDPLAVISKGVRVDACYPQAMSPQMVRIDWGDVAWVTIRDHFVSPLLQGAIW